MSVEFTNTYQEILLDNLVAIIKQNFIFQTQIKLAENASQEKTNLEQQFGQQKTDLEQQFGQQKADLEQQLNELKNQLTSFNHVTEELEMYKNRVNQNSSAHEEKSRIQSALNDEMKKSSLYKEEIDKKNIDIINLSNELKVIMDELEKLRAIVPVAKLKEVEKQKPVEVVKEEPKIQKFIKPVDVKPLKVESGGTF